MTEDNYIKLFLALVAVVSLIFNIFQYVRSHSRFTLNIHVTQKVNQNSSGTYLAGILSVSNTGKSPAYFSGVRINRLDGDYYYPNIDIEGGTKIEPGQTIQGAIPVGHLLGEDAKELIIYDGVWKEYKIRQSRFSKFLIELNAEKKRLESIGSAIHPTSNIT